MGIALCLLTTLKSHEPLPEGLLAVINLIDEFSEVDFLGDHRGSIN